jgi:hypothetical protein
VDLKDHPGGMLVCGFEIIIQNGERAFYSLSFSPDLEIGAKPTG